MLHVTCEKSTVERGSGDGGVLREKKISQEYIFCSVFLILSSYRGHDRHELYLVSPSRGLPAKRTLDRETRVTTLGVGYG